MLLKTEQMAHSSIYPTSPKHSFPITISWGKSMKIFEQVSLFFEQCRLSTQCIGLNHKGNLYLLSFDQGPGKNRRGLQCTPGA